MEILHGGYTLEIPKGAFPLSTDSMVLADFVRLKKGDAILDLGSGCGTLGLLLCAKSPDCRITGIERSEIAHLSAVENIRRNALQTRMESICADLRDLSANNFDVCVSNPPYFTGGPVSKNMGAARHDLFCSADDLMGAASKGLRYGGDFYLVQKPENLALLCAGAVNHGLQPKRLRLVYHRPEATPALILLQCKKGGKPGMKWDMLYLFDTDGTPTEDYKRIYHI